ncbi:hypothetical protein FX985_03318 [Pseudomonas extremaustralis]|uniref:Uncharacterized protein n=1 Tax=Pseudomonas extremaustralis TaxID=359110 RepID=A0A5M9J446_9PSED|nr:hypothetical protein [Pseudomonas extremaustralis]KAA8563250.1 hypothetical protein FX985_03318 [Pseudomonas extremaustralis]
MIRQYRFSELMARLTNEEWTVIQDDRGNFVFNAGCLQRTPVVISDYLEVGHE